MRYLKWAFWTLFWIFVAAFFHYTLPQNDIARVTDGGDILNRRAAGAKPLSSATATKTDMV